MTIRLTYFDFEAFGEPIRLSLRFAGVVFEDRRIKSEDWAAFMPQTPNGTLPMLEIDEMVMTQSLAIVRYIGHKYGLLPTDPNDQYDCDQIIENCLDVYKSMSEIKKIKMFPERYGCECFSDEELDKRTQKMRKNALDGKLTFMLEKIDENLHKTGFLATGKVTVADIFAFCCYRYVSNFEYGIPDNCSDHCKNIMSLKEKFLTMPVIREHYGLPLIMLTGFPQEGLEGPIRLALKIAGIKFEDRRIPVDRWPAIKHTSPNGNLPLLTVNGKVMPQTFAIMRYLGTKYGLQPTDAEECYRVDEVIETCTDVLNTYIKSFEMFMRPEKFGWENSTADQRTALVKKLREGACSGPLPRAMENLGRVLGLSGILISRKVTVGDLYAYCTLRNIKLGWISDIPKEIFFEVGNLVNFMEEMEKLPEIQDHFKITE